MALLKSAEGKGRKMNIIKERESIAFHIKQCRHAAYVLQSLLTSCQRCEDDDIPLEAIQEYISRVDHKLSTALTSTPRLRRILTSIGNSPNARYMRAINVIRKEYKRNGIPIPTSREEAIASLEVLLSVTKSVQRCAVQLDRDIVQKDEQDC